MTPPQDQKPPQLPRQNARVPKNDAEEFRRAHGARGVQGAALVYGWVMQGVQLAREGRDDMLPARGSAPAGRRGDVPLFYTQGAAERAQVDAILHAAGSSVRDLIVACVRAYVAADGDVTVMAWPRRERPLAA